MIFAACDMPRPPSGVPDVGPRRDAGIDAAMPGDGGDDTGTSPDDAGDAAVTDTDTGTMDAGDASGIDAGDAASIDTGVTIADAGTDVGSLGVDGGTTSFDSGNTIMPDGAHPCAMLHASGMPLGAAYGWSGCVLFETAGTGGTIWTRSAAIADHGVAFFHAPSAPSGTTQPVNGTFLLPPGTVPLPYAVVCAGTGSTIDVDATTQPLAFSFRGAASLHTAGSAASGGLVITLGSPATLNGDLGTHHFAATTGTVSSTTSGAVTSMIITMGATAMSLLFEQSTGTISGGVVQLASGTTTDVYTIMSGTATAASITLPASPSFLGTCGGTTGTDTLSGTIAR